MSDLLPVKIMSEVVCTKSQEEYDDDFEKDLDWLISEEGRGEDHVSRASLYNLQFIEAHWTDWPISTFCFFHPPSLFYCVKLSTALLTAYCVLHGSLTLLCESVTVSSVEFPELEHLPIPCETNSIDMQWHTFTVPPPDAILMNTLTHVCYHTSMPITC